MANLSQDAQELFLVLRLFCEYEILMTSYELIWKEVKGTHTNLLTKENVPWSVVYISMMVGKPVASANNKTVKVGQK